MNPLQRLYGRLPEVPCLGCGDCCVSPTCTVIEFVEAMRYLLENSTQERIAEVLNSPPVLHAAFEGNLRCRFHDLVSKKCRIHPSRTLACRLFGLPAMGRFSIENLENCGKMVFSGGGPANESDIRDWLEELTRLNREVSPFYSEPYWVAGFNIECWLAVYFDPFLDFDAFGELKRFLRKELDLSFLEGCYKETTGLKDKVDRITLLYQLIQAGNRPESLALISELRSRYPMTGTYYYSELNKLEALCNSDPESSKTVES